MAASWFTNWYSGFTACSNDRHTLRTISAFYDSFSFIALFAGQYSDPAFKPVVDAYKQLRNKYNTRGCSPLLLAHLERNVDPALRSDASVPNRT